jgi:hypothetical protein
LPQTPALAWLAGFIDGEGTISLGVAKKTQTIRASVSIPNTNLRNIQRAEVLVASVIGHRIRISTKANTKSGHRPCYSIAVSAHADLEMLMVAIAPYAVGKWRHVDLMLEFLRIAPGSQNRSYLDRLYGREPSKRPRRYDVRHFDMVKRMQALNKRYAKGEWDPAQEPEFDEPPPRSPAPFIGNSDDALKELFKRRIG